MSSQAKKDLIPLSRVVDSREGSLKNQSMGSHRSSIALAQAWTAPPELANLNHEHRGEETKESRLSFVVQVSGLLKFLFLLEQHT